MDLNAKQKFSVLIGYRIFLVTFNSYIKHLQQMDGKYSEP